jgi:hypothetical protein
MDVAEEILIITMQWKHSAKSWLCGSGFGCVPICRIQKVSRKEREDYGNSRGLDPSLLLVFSGSQTLLLIGKRRLC